MYKEGRKENLHIE